MCQNTAFNIYGWDAFTQDDQITNSDFKKEMYVSAFYIFCPIAFIPKSHLSDSDLQKLTYRKLMKFRTDQDSSPEVHPLHSLLHESSRGISQAFGDKLCLVSSENICLEHSRSHNSLEIFF